MKKTYTISIIRISSTISITRITSMISIINTFGMISINSICNTISFTVWYALAACVFVQALLRYLRIVISVQI